MRSFLLIFWVPLSIFYPFGYLFEVLQLLEFNAFIVPFCCSLTFFGSLIVWIIFGNFFDFLIYIMFIDFTIILAYSLTPINKNSQFLDRHLPTFHRQKIIEFYGNRLQFPAMFITLMFSAPAILTGLFIWPYLVFKEVYDFGPHIFELYKDDKDNAWRNRKNRPWKVAYTFSVANITIVGLVMNVVSFGEEVLNGINQGLVVRHFYTCYYHLFWYHYRQFSLSFGVYHCHQD